LVAAAVAAAPAHAGQDSERVETERKLEFLLRSAHVVDRRDVHDGRRHLGDQRRDVGRPRENGGRRERRGRRRCDAWRSGIRRLREVALAAGTDAERRGEDNGTKFSFRHAEPLGWACRPLNFHPKGGFAQVGESEVVRVQNVAQGAGCHPAPRP
jgi:hypothetical protein